MKNMIIKILLTLVISNLSLVIAQGQTWKELMDSTRTLLDNNQYDNAKTLAYQAFAIAQAEFDRSDTNYAKILLYLGEVYNTTDLDSAYFYFNNALQIYNKKVDFKSNDKANSYWWIGYVQFMKNDYLNAEKNFETSFSMFNELYKNASTDKIYSLEYLGRINFSLGKINEALKIFQKTVELCQEYENGSGQLTVNYLTWVVYSHYDIGHYHEALDVSKKAYEIASKLERFDTELLCKCLDWLASCNFKLGIFMEASKYWNESLYKRTLYYKKDHPEIAKTMFSLGDLYNEIGELNKADSLYDGSIEMYNRLGKDYIANLCFVLNSKANSLLYRNKFLESKAIHEKVLFLRRQIYPNDHSFVSQSLNNLALVSLHIHNYYEAEKYLMESIEITKRISGENSISIANSYLIFVQMYNNCFNLEKADYYLEKVLKIYEQNPDPDSVNYATALNIIGESYRIRGDYPNAEKYMKASLDLLRRLIKGDQYFIAKGLYTLGFLYSDLGENEKSKKMIIESSEMMSRIYPQGHITQAENYNFLGEVLGEENKIDSALIYFNLSISVFEKIYGTTENTSIYEVLSQIAYLHIKNKKYNIADSLLKVVYNYFNKDRLRNRTRIVTVLLYLGIMNEIRQRWDDAEKYYTEALNIGKEVYNKYQTEMITPVNNLARIYVNQSRYSEAEPMLKYALDNRISTYNNNISFLSEQEKSNYWNKEKFRFDYFYSYVVERYNYNPLLTEEMLNYQLFSKGHLLSSSLKVKRNILNSTDTLLIQKYKNWQDLRIIHSRYLMMNNEEIVNNNVNLDSLQTEIAGIEKDLSNLSQAFKSNAIEQKFDVKKLINSIKHDEAFIDFIRFDKLTLKESKISDTIYYAALIVKDTSSVPELVLLKNGVDLEGKLIDHYRRQIEKQRKGVHDPDAMNATLKELYSQFWAPIQEKLKGINTVYLSPDGVYNQINLNTLINPESGKYLLDELDMRIVTSTRDLVNRNLPINPPPKGDKTAELFGDPQFDLDCSKYVQLASNFRTGITRNYYYLGNTLDSTTRGAIVPLPGTRKEIENIANSFRKQNWTVNKHLGANALEEAVKAADNPRVLHIATHGKFLKDMERRYDKRIMGFETQRFVENPLLRSMLLFSGAENTLLNQGQQSATKREDGLLTAYEAQNLNLDNTELVVLSACETGLGEVKNGEGVYGLQRAFQVAGAKSLIMSLWSVSDKATQELMTSFYSKWLSEKTKRDAFREAQIELKQRYPGFYFWGAFVMVGE